MEIQHSDRARCSLLEKVCPFWEPTGELSVSVGISRERGGSKEICGRGFLIKVFEMPEIIELELAGRSFLLLLIYPFLSYLCQVAWNYLTITDSST